MCAARARHAIPREFRLLSFMYHKKQVITVGLAYYPLRAT